MRDLLSILINPIPVFVLLVLAGFVLSGLSRKKAGKLFFFLSGLWFLITVTPAVPKVLVKSLEGRYTQLSDSIISTLNGPCDIIVLGGGHTDDKNLSPNNQLSLIAMSRLVEGIRIHRMIPGSRLILSGNSKRSVVSEAIVYYRTAIILGINSSSMLLQSTPLNTQMEAEEYLKNFGSENNLILVTSAIHMPRAIMHFRNAGIDPIAAPANFILKYDLHRSPLEWIPAPVYVVMMEAAIHEYVGIMWANLWNK